MWRNADGTFKTLCEAEYNSLTPAQQEMYTKDLAANRKAELDAVRKEASEAKAKTEELETAMKEQGLVIGKLMPGGAGKTQSWEDAVRKTIADNYEAIKTRISSKTQGWMGLSVDKAVGPMTTDSVTFAGPTPNEIGWQLAPGQNINYREVFIDALVNVRPTDQAHVYYTELSPKDGGATQHTETTPKTLMDFTSVTRSAETFAIAVLMRLSNKVVYDLQGLQDIAVNAMRANHDLKRQNFIINGTGDGITAPKGMLAYGKPFVAGSAAASVVMPNIMNVIQACSKQVSAFRNFADEMPYRANLTLMHPDDYFVHFVAAKDTIGRDLYPNAWQQDRITIGTMTIVADYEVPLGQIFVGDASKYKVTNYKPYTVDFGLMGDDFGENMFHIRGESEGHMYVEKQHEGAFVKDAIATIVTAITKP